MATWDVALVREQGVSFAIVAVRDSIISNRSEADELVRSWNLHLSLPVALLGAKQHRSYGRPDIVRWLRNVHPSQLPWRRMTLAA